MLNIIKPYLMKTKQTCTLYSTRDYKFVSTGTMRAVNALGSLSFSNSLPVIALIFSAIHKLCIRILWLWYKEARALDNDRFHLF